MTADTSTAAAPTEHSVRPPRHRRRLLWLVPLVAVPLITGLGLRLLRPSSETATANPPLPVEVTALTSVDAFAIERQYTGEVVAQRSSSLGFGTGGTVVELLVKEGDRISAGQPLARLDSRSLASQRQQLIAQRDQAIATLTELQNGPRTQTLAAAQAAVADLQQQLALSQAQRDRRVELYELGAISREELDQETFGAGALENRLAQSQSQLDELRAGTRPEQIAAQAAQVRQLDASLQTLDIDLSKSVITAPFNGRISQRLIDEGAVVSGGQTVLQLVEGDALEARIGLPAEVADRIGLGSRQTVTVGDRSLPARVTALLPELDSDTRTVTAVLALDTAEELTLGQTAQLVLIQTQATDGFWLPATALVQAEPGLWAVYVAQADAAADPAQVTRRTVEVLHTDGDRILIQGLVQPGDQVITSGTHRIIPGQRVTLTQQP